MGTFGSRPFKPPKPTRIALIGPRGGGKSAFTNAIRGFPDDVEDAATVGIHTIEPCEYSHPAIPEITLYDFPGYDEYEYPNAETYWNAFHLGKFERFIILTKNELTKCDVDLVKKIKSIKSSFFIIRTHIDEYCQSEGTSLKKEEQFKKIKKEMMKRISCQKKQIFLINNYDTYEEDFLVAMEAVAATTLPLDVIMRRVGIRPHKSGIAHVGEYVKASLVRCKNSEVNVGVAGDTSTGKSAFINAIRGLNDGDDGAAEVGVYVEASTEREFDHPNNPMIGFVELPNISTSNFPESTHFEKIRLEEYDVFVILTSTRFTENDLKLARKVEEMGRPYLFVRTKVDLDLRERSGEKTAKQEKIAELRKRVMLEVNIPSKQKIFLIDNYHKEEWDFSLLIDAIINAMYYSKKDCLVLSLSNITRKVIRRKAETFLSKVWSVARPVLLSEETMRVIPAVVDVNFIIVAVAIYYKELGLDDVSEAYQAKLPEKIWELITKKYRITNVKEFMQSTKSEALLKGSVAGKGFQLISTTMSHFSMMFMTILYLLRCIKELEEAALAVWDCSTQSPNMIVKLITVEGGVIKKGEVTLTIGPGCLAEHTEITLIKHDQNMEFKSLLVLGLIDTPPYVFELLPDGLKFLKPAHLTIRFEAKTALDSELSILHRSYKDTDWELEANDIQENTEKGIARMKINGFSFYTYFIAERGKFARILSHLNNSFSSRAYVFYRRQQTMNPLEISVVLISEYVEDNQAQQLKDHDNEGYTQGGKGFVKTVHTNRQLEIRLDFPGIERSPYPFKVDLCQLDSGGFVVDDLEAVAINGPANGAVEVHELQRNGEKNRLWRLNVCEEQNITGEQALVRREERLPNSEIIRLSGVLGVDWDCLAGLLDIPYSQREEIRTNQMKYPDCTSKASKIFSLYNNREDPEFYILRKCFQELERQDLLNELPPVENQIDKSQNDKSGNEEKEACTRESDSNDDDVRTSSQPFVEDYDDLQNTPLSSRETYRLSRKIGRDWECLASLMDIATEDRENIQSNSMYTDNRAKAEKVLSIFNNKKSFSREKLVECLRELKKFDLVSPVTTGQWRIL